MLLYKGRKYWMYVHIGYKLPERSKFICHRDGAGMLLEFSKQSRICVPTAVCFNLSVLSCTKTLTTTDWSSNNTGLNHTVKRLRYNNMLTESGKQASMIISRLKAPLCPT